MIFMVKFNVSQIRSKSNIIVLETTAFISLFPQVKYIGCHIKKSNGVKKVMTPNIFVF